MNRLPTHVHSDRKHHQQDTSSTNQKITQEVHLRSTPRDPGQETHAPNPIMQSQAKIQNQDPTLEAHLCITICGGVRAIARCRKPTLRSDLRPVVVDLVGGSEKC
jgi:hypothetical protein